MCVRIWTVAHLVLPSYVADSRNGTMLAVSSFFTKDTQSSSAVVEALTAAAQNVVLQAKKKSQMVLPALTALEGPSPPHPPPPHSNAVSLVKKILTQAPVRFH